jgi:hypothetical protein
MGNRTNNNIGVFITGTTLCLASIITGAIMCADWRPYWPFILNGPLCVIVIALLANRSR